MTNLDKLTELTDQLSPPYLNSKILHLLLELCSDAYWIWHIPSGYDYLSPGWQTLLGYSEDELIHHVDTWKELMHPDDLGPTMEVLNLHFDSKGSLPYEIKFRLMGKNGEYVSVFARGAVVTWEGDEAIIMAGRMDHEANVCTKTGFCPYKEIVDAAGR